MRIDKDNIKIILILLVVCLGIGYSYLNTELNINGTANINSANWNVYWNNVQVESGSVTAPTPTIDSDKTTVSYTVTLEKPRDYYEFTVDAVNAGTIDAMINSIDFKLNGVTITTLPDYLGYTVTYEDGIELEPNHLLAANSTETYKVNIKYRDDIELNQIPATNQTISLQLTVIYRQATENAVEKPQVVYTANLATWNYTDTTVVVMGRAIPAEIVQYSNGLDAMNALRVATNDNSIQSSLKHNIQNGVVIASYIEFIITTEMASANPGMTPGTYSIRGAGVTQDPSTGNYNKDSIYYNSNKAALIKAFGSNNCDEDSVLYTCGVPGLYASVGRNGIVYTTSANSWSCGVTMDGSCACHRITSE